MSVVPYKYRITLYQGTDWELPVQFIFDEVPIDLTGCSMKMHIRQSIDADLELELSTDNGGIVIGSPASNGEFKIIVTPADLADMTWETGVYDLEITYPNTKTERLMYGAVLLSREVTR